MSFINKQALLFVVLFFIACGSSSSDRGMLIEGQLTEGAGVDHTKIFKHAINEGIEEVEVCALGACSTTDGNGNFGFVAPEEFTGGDVLFSINGHVIDTTVIVSIKDGTKEVFVHFENHNGNVKVHHLDLDNKRVGNDHAHQHSDHNDHKHDDKEHTHNEADKHSDSNHHM